MFCPIMSHQKPYENKVSCSKECGFYNKDKEECAILSISKEKKILPFNTSNNNSNIENIYN